jgi:hypothetical protein
MWIILDLMTLKTIKPTVNKFLPWANSTIASYNANVAKMYNIINSLARFEGKNIFFCSLKTL